jgi:Thioredoxin
LCDRTSTEDASAARGMTKPLLAVPIGPEDHALGSDTAAIQLVEFGDYQCSYCAEAHLVIRELQQQFGDALLFVFRNMPLGNLHPRAEAAAEAAEAAGLRRIMGARAIRQPPAPRAPLMPLLKQHFAHRPNALPPLAMIA